MGVVIDFSTHAVRGNLPMRGVGELPASSGHEIDAAVGAVAGRRRAWQALSVAARVQLLDQVMADTAAVAAHWVAVECERKHVAWGSPAAGEEWSLGPWVALRCMRLLRRTLQDIERHGHPQLPAPVRSLPDGRACARVHPTDVYDRIFDSRLTADVLMPRGIGVDQVLATVGGPYRANARRRVRVGAVLGAGNASAIPFLDVIYKMFGEDQVVVLKLNPITDGLAPVFGQALRALIEASFLRIVHVGAAEASHLINHEAVEVVHITGSDKTHDAIVFGTDQEAATRKATNTPVLQKPITSELGSVTPVIVVPGDWSRRDFEVQARLIATMFAHGASYECSAARLLITDRRWSGREELLAALRRVLHNLPNRFAFYPGAEERFALFGDAHPERELLGAGMPGSLPWALITGVDPQDEDIVFTTDPFAPVLSETALDAASVAEFIAHAVRFVNDRVWGTLGVSLIVHPDSLRDPRTAAAVDSAIADLRYGTIVANGPTSMGFAYASVPWGAFPGHQATDIRSGRGFVHNTYLLAQPEKTVIRAAFRPVPNPPWVVTHRHSHEVFRRLSEFESAPRAAKLPAIFWDALKG